VAGHISKVITAIVISLGVALLYLAYVIFEINEYNRIVAKTISAPIFLPSTSINPLVIATFGALLIIFGFLIYVVLMVTKPSI